MPYDPAKLKKFRAAAKMTQAQAATRAKMSQSSWADIERGRTGNPGVNTLEQAAKAVGAPGVDALLSK